jgi:hypothetical protein
MTFGSIHLKLRNSSVGVVVTCVAARPRVRHQEHFGRTIGRRRRESNTVLSEITIVPAGL